MTTVPGIPNLRLNNNAPQRALAAMASPWRGGNLLKNPSNPCLHVCMWQLNIFSANFRSQIHEI